MNSLSLCFPLALLFRLTLLAFPICHNRMPPLDNSPFLLLVRVQRLSLSLSHPCADDEFPLILPEGIRNLDIDAFKGVSDDTIHTCVTLSSLIALRFHRMKHVQFNGTYRPKISRECQQHLLRTP